LIKLPFGYFIGKQKEPEPTVYFVRKQQPEPTMSKYQLDQLEPKSWKTGIWQKKPWKAMGISWNRWRSMQSDYAVDFYIKNFPNMSQQECADKFGISINAFVMTWQWFKEENKVEVICK